jgi:hypothetical protein
MSIVQNVETRKQQSAGNYEVTRFNALQHGVLSRHTVLPWENTDEYHALIEALVVEHKPQGPTEEHLVEELAGIIWRKGRLRLAERAAHHRALLRATDPLGDTAKAALIHIAAHDGKAALGEAIRASEPQTAEEFVSLEADQAMIKEVLRLLSKPTSSAYSRALGALREGTREWWEDQLASEPDDYDEDETPYRADAESLKRFLENEVLAWYERRGRELDHRPMIRAQAFGEAVDPHRLERLARYEVHLDRKLERMLAMLFKLQELRRAANPT